MEALLFEPTKPAARLNRAVARLGGSLSLGLVACSGCSLLVEENSRFSADTGAMNDTEGSSMDTDPWTDTEGLPDTEPPRPAWLSVRTVGDPDDADVDPLGPGLLLAGGEFPIRSVYEWQAQYIDHGDIVILQNDDLPLLNDYLYVDIGGADSVQTVTVPPGAASWDPWIAWTLAHAEAVLIVGEDPYGLNWKNTPIESGIMAAWDRGAVIGGIEWGLSSLGEFVYPGYGVPLSSAEALADPYSPNVALDSDYLSLELLDDALIESNFSDGDRMGRLLTFAARVLQDGWSSTFVGIGVDEDAAMVIGPDGLGEVHGSGHVYVFRVDEPAAVCAPGVALEFGPVTVHRLAAGDTASWPGGQTNVAGMDVSSAGGGTIPVFPY